MEWELSKENVQPLRKGRKVEVLNEALKCKEAGAAAVNNLENQRRLMIQAIDSYQGEDPLEPWIQYIKWVKDEFPSGGAQSELQPVLELCTRTFQNDERYKSDSRYLRVWVQYADCCTEPRDIYAFLEAHSIGQDHALFYEAYASNMECCKNYSKANEIYELGIQRGAQPKSRLESMYQSFLKRMMQRNEKRLQKDQEDLYEPDKLRTFGENRTSGRSSARHLPSFQEQQRLRVQPPQMPRQGMAVFVDPEFQSGTQAPSTFQSAHVQASPAIPTWKNLGTQAEVKKENTQMPAKWNETKVPRLGKTPKHVDVHPAIDVYIDEECEAAHARVKEKNESAAPASLRLRLDDVPSHRRDQEALNKDPLLYFKDGAEKPSLTALLGRKSAHRKDKETAVLEDLLFQPGTQTPFIFQSAQVPASSDEAHDDDCSSTATLSAPVHLTGHEIYKSREDGHETSFEEARLLKWKASSQQQQQQHQWNPASSPRNSAEKAKMIEKSLNMFHSERVKRNSRINASEESFAGSMMPPPPPSRPPTLLTRGSSQFDEPPAFACSMPVTQIGGCGDGGGTLASVVSNGEETVAIKKYAEQLIKLGADPNARSIDAVGHQGLVDQTINTKECLQDILSMFNRPLSCEKPGSRAKTSKNHPSKPFTPDSGEGFQVFLDDDLDAPPPAPKNSRIPKKESFNIFQDGEESIPSRGRASARSGTAQGLGFEVFVDEDNIKAAGPPPKNNRDRTKETSFAIFQDDENSNPRRLGKPAPGPVKGFEVFLDEELDVRPKQSRIPSKTNQKAFEVYNDEEVAPKKLVRKPTPFAVFVDEDLDASESASSSLQSLKGSAKAASSFQVYTDDEQDTRPRTTSISTSSQEKLKPFAVFEDEVLPAAPRNVESRIPRKPMPKPKSSSGFSIFVDEDLPSQPVRKQPSSSSIARR